MEYMHLQITICLLLNSLKKLEIKFAITWFDITGITLLIFQQATPQIGLPAVN